MSHNITIAAPRKLDVRPAALQQACCSCGWRSGIGMRGKVNRDANQHARAMAAPCSAPHPAQRDVTCDLPPGHGQRHRARRPGGFDRWDPAEDKE